ncbi:MAG TPA: PTS sugar transporter subunit IIA [Nitrososphaeria archaeon]|nr:PTS sugar transporter subunit IIA [Nitrososphaeria archaeon]
MKATKVYYTFIDCDDSIETLKRVSEYLYDKGLVKETYVESLLKREKEFPTGLQSEKGVGVAIPHADIEHVLEEAFVAIFPTKTLHFHKMDEPDKEIPVDLVLLLVVKSTQGYMKFLSDLASTINDEKFAELVESRKTEEIIDFLVKNILKKHFKVERVERVKL